MTVPEKIEVWLHNLQVGSLALTTEGLCAFEYTSEWLKNGFSISPFELPLTAGVKIAKRSPFDGGFGVFDDCLPDGWGRLILSRYLLTQGIRVEQLNLLQQLCLVGSQGRGALEFRPDRSLAERQDYADFERLAAETEAILDSDRYTGENLQELLQRGGSPGGARPKIFVKDHEGEWLVKFRALSTNPSPRKKRICWPLPKSSACRSVQPRRFMKKSIRRWSDNCHVLRYDHRCINNVFGDRKRHLPILQCNSRQSI